DQLKLDLMKVHVVGNRPAIDDADMRGDVATALAIRNQIAIQHARAPGAPRSVAGADDRIRRLERWHAIEIDGVAGAEPDQTDAVGTVTDDGDARIVGRKDRLEAKPEPAEQCD